MSVAVRARFRVQSPMFQKCLGAKYKTGHSKASRSKSAIEVSSVSLGANTHFRAVDGLAALAGENLQSPLAVNALAQAFQGIAAAHM